jgi:RNA polymerase-binding transcription factor DksA
VSEDPQLSDQAVESIRSQLEHGAAHLHDQLTELGRDDKGLDFDEGFADTAHATAEQDENQSLATQLRDQLDDVQAALGRLDDGTYGHCAVCGQPISEARLEALPATRFCIEHAG